VDADAVTWIKVDDDFYDHPKFLALTHSGVALWVTALAWCGHHKTDGVIPRAAVQRLGHDFATADALVAAGLWITTDTGWRVHEFTEYQRSAEQVEKLSAAGRKAAAQRWSGSRSHTNRNANRNADTDTDTDTEEDQNHCSPEASATPTPIVDFASFWAVYPRRDDKRRAERAWESAIRRADPADIVIAAARYAADPNRVAQFTKQPATWLNADAWLNGPQPSRGATESVGMRLIRRAAAMPNGAHTNGNGADDRRELGSPLGPLPRTAE